MMDELISRQAAIAALREGALINYQFAGHNNGLVKAIDVINGLSSVQQIVRCKDCIHRPIEIGANSLKFPDFVCPCQCEDYYYSWMPSDNFFCARGEGREQ